jgi:hypothetical protein
MESNKADIIPINVKNYFEILFRKNIFMVIIFVIIANGYSNIPGVSELLTEIFKYHTLRFLITFIIFFQIIDNFKESLVWTIIIFISLYIIEYKFKNRKNNLNNNNNGR